MASPARAQTPAPTRPRAPIVRPRPRRTAVPSAGLAPTAPILQARAKTALVAALARLRERCMGQTVFVLASGPSLTPGDVALVRATGLPVIVTNTTFRLAPWADAIYAQDRKWWRAHRPELITSFRGLCFSGQPLSGPDAAGLAVTNIRHCGIDTFRNSGAGAIALAVHSGAARVVCLGLDGQAAPDGRRHWHGAHPPGLGDAGSMLQIGASGQSLWQERLGACAAWCQQRGVPVLNASRSTALTCFARAPLEDLLPASAGETPLATAERLIVDAWLRAEAGTA